MFGRWPGEESPEDLLTQGAGSGMETSRRRFEDGGAFLLGGVPIIVCLRVVRSLSSYRLARCNASGDTRLAGMLVYVTIQECRSLFSKIPIRETLKSWQVGFLVREQYEEGEGGVCRCVFGDGAPDAGTVTATEERVGLFLFRLP